MSMSGRYTHRAAEIAGAALAVAFLAKASRAFMTSGATSSEGRGKRVPPEL